MAWSRTAWSSALVAAQAAALVATFLLPGLGARLWHHGASLAAVLAGLWACRRLMASRRFLGLGVLASTLLAVVSGFYLLYWKEGIRADGHQDWGVFWHVAWSWVCAVFIWQHTWVNRVAWLHFFRRSLQAAAPAVLHLGLYALAAAGFLWTLGPGRAWFTNESYIPLSLWTWLVVAGSAYSVWLVGRRRAPGTRARAGIDLALVPASAVAVLSGLPLLLLDAPLQAAGLQYASKYWHVGPSILFAVLVFTHSVQLWNAVRRYWQRVGASSAAVRSSGKIRGRAAPGGSPRAARPPPPPG